MSKRMTKLLLLLSNWDSKNSRLVSVACLLRPVRISRSSRYVSIYISYLLQTLNLVSTCLTSLCKTISLGYLWWQIINMYFSWASTYEHSVNEIDVLNNCAILNYHYLFDINQLNFLFHSKLLFIIATYVYTIILLLQ